MLRGEIIPKTVESIVASVNLNGNGPGVRFGHTTIALHDDELGPDFVVDLMPFVQHLLDVILIKLEYKRREIKG